MPKRSLNTSNETFERLHEMADGRRTKVTVSRDDLMGLLMDHSIMREMLQYQVEEPRRQRSRPSINKGD